MAKTPDPGAAAASPVPQVLNGLAASPGIAVGPVFRLTEVAGQVEERDVPSSQVEAEIARFHDALTAARGELTVLRETTEHDLGEDSARLFDVQLMVLQDPLAVERTEEAIRTERKNAEFLFRRHVREIADQLESLGDDFFSERAIDLLDVKSRVLRHLGSASEGVEVPPLAGILLGKELAPSDAVQLDPERVRGLVLETGGVTGHAAIMARAKGIPAVVGVRGLTEAVRDGAIVAVDGFQGVVSVHPDAASLKHLEQRREAFERVRAEQMSHAAGPARTRDGHEMLLAANMETPEEVPGILMRGAEGIGLVRTEFFFMSRRQAPSEEEQFTVYRRILSSMAPRPVVFRALDVGGDKVASYLGMGRERNPFLGMRGIRYLLAHPDIFRTQVRAILRAATHGTARLLLPMISTLSELRAAKTLIAEVSRGLTAEGIEHEPGLPLGVMIEVPSAVWIADELAAESDFLSVGSNDLIQYLLALDRGNAALQGLYDPHHPAVLRAIRQTVEAGHRHGRRVSICGEMAGNALSVPLLLGLGFDRLSVSPSLVPEIKEAVRSVDYAACIDLVEAALAASDGAAVRRLIHRRMGAPFAEFLGQTEDNDPGEPEVTS